MKLDRIKKLSEKQLSAIVQKSEFDIQCEIVNYCRLNNIICFSVPNEAARDNSKYIRSGLMAGVSDLIVLLPNVVLFVEVKTTVGRQSDKQKAFQSKVESLGFKYFLVRSLEDFKAIPYLE